MSRTELNISRLSPCEQKHIDEELRKRSETQSELDWCRTGEE